MEVVLAVEISWKFEAFAMKNRGENEKSKIVEKNKKKKPMGVCETVQYDPGGNKVEKAIFSFKVKVKVTRSLTLVSFERASLV